MSEIDGFREQVASGINIPGDQAAVFLVDALRYEMAAELARDLQVTGTKVAMMARFA